MEENHLNHLKLRQDVEKEYGEKGLAKLAKYDCFNTMYVVKDVFPNLWRKYPQKVRKGLYDEFIEGHPNFEKEKENLIKINK